ncbi:MAG TPA: 50S ribosomal protein L13 [bacterium]|nr:50S ribosomal protein L13 [bacterium]HPN35900.1 50S ribosomal protein L13 [bacterium]
MKTLSPKPQDIEQKWYVIDAKGLVLGRLASKIAGVLRGKNKPFFSPHVECGDFIVVVNADKYLLTGNKLQQKTYTSYSGYPGGLRKTPIARVAEKKPEFVLREAVRGMLPHNRLGRKLLKNLKLYTESEHPHSAQKPEVMNL